MKTFTPLLLLILLGGFALHAAAPPRPGPKIVDTIKGAEGLEEALRRLKAPLASTPKLSPTQSHKAIKSAGDVAVDLVLAEPTVRQPLYLTFDERGRMWVVNYVQYPFPAGVKIVAYDRYIRAKFDRVPPPPPRHFKGADRITIHEDTKGDGSFSKVSTFVEGLNIATAALPGRGGAWVLNPPYLLFYPDPTRSDKPGVPVVHLSGFGLEDTHAVASSLTWGPDGWLYGAHGSTCTAKVKVEIIGAKTTTDFLGQAIWRYHPETHVFELFAEGGGNTFGVAFDEFGRLYSGTNWGRFRGLHYVQGGYYIKGWGKHGPLTNPFAFGFFDHMPHIGNADRLTHTFLFYYGGALPDHYRGRLLAVNPLQKRVQVTRLDPLGSTFRSTEEPFLLSSTDGWFRPIDIKVGPDGAVYFTDLYEQRISHVDPRDNWDRATGRIYRVRPKSYTPAPRRDLGRASSRELVELLDHPNRWYRDTALRLLGDLKDRSVAPLLRDRLRDPQKALDALWALHLCGGFNDTVARETLEHANPHVRRWTARLLGDKGTISADLAKRLVARASKETNPEVRSQLASTAKRLSAEVALPLLRALWQKDDSRDPHIPLLTWWALERHAGKEPERVLATFSDRSVWKSKVVQGTILERLPQRWAMAGGKDNLEHAARLLGLAPDVASTEKLLAGLEKGFAGGAAREVPAALREAVTRAWDKGARSGQSLLGLRLGEARALQKALAAVENEKTPQAQRTAFIRILGELDEPSCVPVLLRVLRTTPSARVRQEVLTALPRYGDEEIGKTVLTLLPTRLADAGSRSAALGLLASRPAWSRQLLSAIESKKVNPRSVPLEVVQKLGLHKDREVVRLLTRHYGKVRTSSPLSKLEEMARVARLLKAGKGNAIPGKEVYKATCAKCHKLFGEGGEVGPDLTGYERDNLTYWLQHIVDPSASIREEYTTFVVETKDGRTLTGIVAGQDAGTVTLRDPEGRTIQLARRRIADLRASPVSLMPEDLLRPLNPQQTRDLFAYLMKK